MDQSKPLGRPPLDQALAALAAGWAALEAVLGPLGAAPTTANAQRMMQLADALLDHLARPQPAEGLNSLLRFVTEWLDAFERTQVSIPETHPADVLRHLMQANGLVQRDLAAELGGQPNVSAILNGHRLINLQQAKNLGRRFGMSPAAFIEDWVAGAMDADSQRTTSGPVQLVAVSSGTMVDVTVASKSNGGTLQ